MAGMLLLAHVVVPHHHHDPVDVCVVGGHEGEAHHSDDGCPSGGHDHADSYDCILGDVILRQSDGVPAIAPEQLLPLYFTDIYIPKSEPLTVCDDDRGTYGFLYKERLFTLHLYSATGLRAPPFMV